MKRYSLYILTIVSLLISCTDSKEDYISPNKGKEVAFSASVENGNHKSRTVYGSEITSGDVSSVVVNWVDGDKITVYAPDCSVKKANYSIVTGGKEQNYANDLVKEGAAGIQWGTSEGSAFYAIYPAVEGTFSENDNGYTAVETQISPIQYVDFGTEIVGKTETNPGTWVGTPYNVGQEGKNMPNALMYAYSSYESSMDEKGNPREVNLRFKPYSTVLKFTLNGWEAGNGMSDYHSGTKVEVKKLKLEAPYTIAGKCLFEFPENNDGNPTVTSNESDEAASSIIEVYPKKNVLLGEGEKLEFSIFAIPQEYTMDATDYWTVSLETDYGVFTYKMMPSVDSENTELISGQIHKITIPTLEINTGAVELDAKQWIKYIPRNVYLSELSIPGAWYATNSDYQGSATLSEMYTNGVRAFNIDCRMTYLKGTSGDMDLYCAGSEKHNSLQANDGTTVLTALTQLAGLLPTYDEANPNNYNPEEYIVVVLTIAEKPKTSSGNIMGTVDPETVIAKINEILKTNASALKLYTTPITPNTTVGDVLGKMIVKVNINSSIDTFKDFEMWNNVAGNASQYALYSEGTISSESTGNIVAGNFKTMNASPMYWGNSLCNPELIYYYHQTQRTFSTNPYTDTSKEADEAKYLGIPTIDERKLAINNIIEQSASIYKNNLHNGWFQLGIGGYVKDRSYSNGVFGFGAGWGDTGSEDRALIATELNTHVYNKIQEKLKTTPSPIGIVLMNHCTNNTYKSLDLVNAIIEMNTRFYLNRNIEQSEWPDGKNPWDTAAPPSTEDGDGDLGNS